MRKKILAIVTSILLSVSLFITPFASYAASLTQATDSSKVEYGTLTQADKDFLSQFFDAEYYAANNPDVVTNYGNSRQALLDHFFDSGIWEGRGCNAEFDPAAYASAYPELRKMYGKNIMAYFRDFYSKTAEERATLKATLEACAKAGITVKGLADDSIVITPELYYIAKRYNINSLATAKAIQQALKTGQPTEVQGNGNGTVDEDDDVVIVPAGGNEEALLKAKGLTDTGIQINGQDGVLLHIYVSYTMDGRDINVTGAAIKAAVGEQQELQSVLTYQDYSEEGEYEYFEAAQISVNNVTEAFDMNGVQVPAVPKISTTCCSYDERDQSFRYFDATSIECTSGDVYPIEIGAYYADSNGDDNTAYTVTGDISLEGEGYDTVVSGSVGLYNEETGFGYVAEYSANLFEAQ